MNALFFKRFIQRPFQVASIVPSSKALIRSVTSKFDFSEPRVIAEFGPGEGCHTREIVRRMHPQSRLLLFELDAELAEHLRKSFRHDHRVEVLHTDAANLPHELAARGLDHCDYVVSGIPFSILEPHKKRAILQAIHDSLVHAPHAAFIIYQFTNELRARGHCDHFGHAETDFVLQSIPPNFVTKFYKLAMNGNGKKNGNGKHHRVNGNGNGRH